MTVGAILVILLLKLMKLEHSSGKIIYIYHSKDMECKIRNKIEIYFLSEIIIAR